MEGGGKRKRTTKTDGVAASSSKTQADGVAASSSKTQADGVVASSSKTRRASKLKRSTWCRDCWSRASSACSSSQHALVDAKTALAETTAAFDARLREMEATEQRLRAVQAALEEDGAAVLEVDVANNADGNGWYIEGGTVRITMAPVTALSAKDKKAICSAWGGGELEYGGGEGAYAFCRVELELPKGVLSKLPDRVEGQTLPANTILLGSHSEGEKSWQRRVGSYFKIYDAEVRPHVGKGDKVFGRAGDMSAFRGVGCEGDDCRSHERLDCYCTTHYKSGTTIREASFLRKVVEYELVLDTE